MSIDTSAWYYLSVLAIKVYLYPFTFISLILWFSHSWFALCNVTTFECGKGSRHIDYQNYVIHHLVRRGRLYDVVININL
jgi:hypothetical protein